MKLVTRTGVVLTAAALSLSLAACSASNEPAASGSSDTATTGTDAGATTAALSGTLNGAGSSAQESAMDTWRAAFQSENPDLVINYDPVGSGGGRTQFFDGAVSWAGSDSALSEADGEYDAAAARCGTDGAINLPVYISPIAVVFNLPGVTSLNLDSATIAKIFDGKITKWNDDAIASQNDGVTLPDTAITIVHRADDSGTTKNFTDYLAQTSDGAWGYDASGVWPTDKGESGQGTSGLMEIVTGTEGAIGYADDSKAGDMGKVAIKVGEEYNAPSSEGAATTLSDSTVASVNGDNDLAYTINRTTTQSGAYPLMLLSYAIVCQSYDDATEAANVTGFLSYVASEAGQQAAASASGSAPLPTDLSAQVEDILAQIAG
ncbi:phosphate ABC transporter substrate-binding protein PstS [Demequina soli]|uniref:phosphate ABC transporter substrate-binding protein PstS n=1 Tax=Demequina soli TaxID=1638987 RepID=UPI000782F66A|nr:phosphate ABC transporter substrate-binding protein PstS [Demequina soli]